MVKQCGCYTPTIPFDVNSTAFKGLYNGTGIKICEDVVICDNNDCFDEADNLRK